MDRFPDAGIGADVICGFPGESDQQFNDTYRLLKELPITHFHVFPYSKRKNTIAARRDDHIQHGVKKDRVRALKALGEAKLLLFTEDQVGLRSDVLFERKNKAGFWEGYTTNFVRVQCQSSENLKNQVKRVYLSEFRENKLFGLIEN